MVLYGNIPTTLLPLLSISRETFFSYLCKSSDCIRGSDKLNRYYIV